MSKRVAQFAETTGAVALLVTMVLLSLEAFYRYIVGSPLRWPTTLSSSLTLSLIVFVPLFAVGYHRSHIRVTFLADKLAEGRRSGIWRALTALELPVWALLLYAAVTSSLRYYDLPRQVSLFHVPQWITFAIIATGILGALLWAMREVVRPVDGAKDGG